VNARVVIVAAALNLAALMSVDGGVTAAAASLVLGEAETREALAVGEQTANADVFDTEWRVKNAAGESVSVMTPFHRLVLASRQATHKNQPLKPDEPQKLLREQRDRLVVWVELRGSREDFARFYQPALVAGDRTIKAAFVQNERTALREDSGRYLARCVYAFPTKEITGKSRVTLVVRDGDGRPASAFTIDLSTMR
jgi:hypothetical protein